MPQICVMGDQSSGKSSVLEALSGIPFPRGTGLVTRCPIRMVMKRARAGEKWSSLVSTSLNPQQFPVRDVAELNSVMERLTNELCAGSNNFSTESIIVELTSPDAFDLTVVDLPGIIRTVTAGQNVASIEQVNRLIKSFLSDKRTIILAVIPANHVCVRHHSLSFKCRDVNFWFSGHCHCGHSGARSGSGSQRRAYHRRADEDRSHRTRQRGRSDGGGEQHPQAAGAGLHYGEEPLTEGDH